MAIYFLYIFFFLTVSYNFFIFLIVFFFNQSFVRPSLYNTWLNELNLPEVALQRFEKRKKGQGILWPSKFVLCCK